jgi:hypothetical protein
MNLNKTNELNQIGLNRLIAVGCGSCTPPNPLALYVKGGLAVPLNKPPASRDFAP